MTTTTTQDTFQINRPVPFTGTDAERAANRDSHWFDYSDGDARCYDCDCRPSHVAANYPCGVHVPRELATIERGTGRVISTEAR